MFSRLALAGALSVVLPLAACSKTQELGGPPEPTVARMDFTRAAGLYAAPFPSDDLRRADGTVDLSKVPNPNNVILIRQALELLSRDARGFGTSSAVYFAMTGAIDPASLPTVEGSVAGESPVFLIDVDSGKRSPARVTFSADGGPFGDRFLIAVLPLQGLPLKAGARYAAVLRKGVRDVLGAPIAVSSGLEKLLVGGAPAGLSGAALDVYRRALSSLTERGIGTADVAAIAVFTTDDPVAPLARLVEAAQKTARPKAPVDLARTAVFDEFCVYRGTVQMPVYQRGEPPYSRTGGDIVLDDKGQPPIPRMERAAVTLTVPRIPMPKDGYPVVVLAKPGLGGMQPLVDRGAHAKAGAPDVPGTGPAREYALAGFAGMTVDGPLTASRNTTGGDEQFLIFNFQNAAALRDNIRQSALELALVPGMFAELTWDVSDCAGAETGGAKAKLDAGHAALFGHSMGATIAPLSIAVAEGYGTLLLSGAGGSWIENVMDKRKPTLVRPIAEALVAYPMDGRSLTDEDPALSLVQWGAEMSDPQVYGGRVLAGPKGATAVRNVLMMQAIVDNYILPDTANGLSLTLGVDLAGEALDEPSRMGLAGQASVTRWLPLVGRHVLPLPVSRNRADNAGVTAALTQNLGDGIEDGHEAVWQTEGPKRQYRCFLSTWVKGIAVVPRPGARDAPCD